MTDRWPASLISDSDIHSHTHQTNDTTTTPTTTTTTTTAALDRSLLPGEADTRGAGPGPRVDPERGGILPVHLLPQGLRAERPGGPAKVCMCAFTYFFFNLINKYAFVCVRVDLMHGGSHHHHYHHICPLCIPSHTPHSPRPTHMYIYVCTRAHIMCVVSQGGVPPGLCVVALQAAQPRQREDWQAALLLRHGAGVWAFGRCFFLWLVLN
jgi:hypothetical protein